VEAASGLGFEEYLREYVWGPAAMFSTALDVPNRLVPHRARGYLVSDSGVEGYPREDVSYKYAGGGMIGSAEDLVRFGWALNRGELLRPETLALMWSPHVDPVRKFDDGGPPILEGRWKLGLAWRIRDDDNGRTFVYAPGTVNGFNAVLLNYQEEEVVVAVLGNGHPVTPALREALTLAGFFLGSSGRTPPLEASDPPGPR
jgi:CubicO group peptidase (beta-lactamase class C family)